MLNSKTHALGYLFKAAYPLVHLVRFLFAQSTHRHNYVDCSPWQ